VAEETQTLVQGRVKAVTPILVAVVAVVIQVFRQPQAPVVLVLLSSATLVA